MSKIEIQPELRTSGGEALSLHRDGEWIGDVFLVYRENDVLNGTVQLDQMTIDEDEVPEIMGELRSYLVNLTYALNVTDHHIHVYHGQYSHWEDFLDGEDFDLDDEEEDGYERWIVGHGAQGIEYQIYDNLKNLVAEAVVDLKGTRIVGEINFTEEPTEQLMEDVEAIVLKDYDHDLIDQYNFTFLVGGAEYEEVTIEPEEEEDIPAYGAAMDDIEILERVESDEEEDDDEELEKAEVTYDLVDKDDHHLAEARFLYSEDGVDVTVDMKVKPNEDITHHMMRMVFKEALTEPMEWVNIRMQYKGRAVDGFHFERGQDEVFAEI